MISEEFSRNVTIQPGGVVRIESPDRSAELAAGLPAGAKARVVVILEDRGPEPSPLATLVGRSPPVFSSAAEVDAFIRQEREDWGS